MLKKIRAAAQNSKPIAKTGTVIAEGIQLENARIRGFGNIHIDGIVTGQVELEGHLSIGKQGKLTGPVKAVSMTVAGFYDGDAAVSETLHLAPHSHISGTIQTGKMIVDDGAVLNATCTMLKESMKEVEMEIKAQKVYDFDAEDEKQSYGSV